MSIEASSFVLGLSMGRGNGLRKLILLGYANHADKHGQGAYPSTHTIAAYAECDARTVQRHIGWLLAAGYLQEGDQRMVDHLDPRYRPIVYDVAMSPEKINQWAAEAGPSSGNRSRAAQAGRRGGLASSQLGRGDNLSSLTEDESPQVSRGDNMQPLESRPRGDSSGDSGVTNHTPRGDSSVTRTIQEPSTEPSSSSRAPERASPSGAGTESGFVAEVLDVLPESVRDHPSVVVGALARRVQALYKDGWSRAEVRRRLDGVETANEPGAAAIARLASLAVVNAPAPSVPRPRWCGCCDEHTRLREASDGRPYRCPGCHPLRSAVDGPPVFEGLRP